MCMNAWERYLLHHKLGPHTHTLLTLLRSPKAHVRLAWHRSLQSALICMHSSPLHCSAVHCSGGAGKRMRAVEGGDERR